MDPDKQHTVTLWLYGPFVTIVAFIAGLVVAYWLDRLDRRTRVW